VRMSLYQSLVLGWVAGQVTGMPKMPLHQLILSPATGSIFSVFPAPRGRGLGRCGGMR
jgi:hypothetical protein